MSAAQDIVLGPFNRVEGDLEVRLEVRDGVVQAARVNSPLYRGFEQILLGRDPRDALVYAPRICGICSVSQSMAAAYALAEAQRIDMPPNGQRATNLVLANENLADHFTHFYLFFMPDFARDAYRAQPWYPRVAERFWAMTGSAAREAVPARAQFLRLMGVLAGKWPHSLSLQPGGTARALDPRDRVRVLAILRAFRRFLENRTFGDRLEAIAALDGAAALRRWMAARDPWSSDFRVFLELADRLELARAGRLTPRLLSYGNYPVEGERLFRPGVWAGAPGPLDIDAVTEDVSHAWLGGRTQPLPPAQGVTLPLAAKPEAYTWCKAPRLDGRVMETGALARQGVAGHPLIRDLLDGGGSNVRSRVIARLLELALVLPVMERWVREIRPGEPFCAHGTTPRHATGVGLVEAARGSLGHWLEIRQGRILNYQIVAPTTWNFSPRDRDGVPGALEQALVGTVVPAGEATPVMVQHVVRSFDPCMVCTVH
ncbi:MAG: nickel-dependent hydrogenase large subunit [Gammaproteobacteria bacterium]